MVYQFRIFKKSKRILPKKCQGKKRPNWYKKR